MFGLIFAVIDYSKTAVFNSVQTGTFLWWWYLVTGVLSVGFYLLGLVGSDKKKDRERCFGKVVDNAIAMYFGILGANYLLTEDLNRAGAYLFVCLCFSILSKVQN